MEHRPSQRGPGDPARVLQDLGFVVPDELAALGTEASTTRSAPSRSRCSTDVVLWEPAVLELLPQVEEYELYATLDVATEDRDIS